MKKSLLTLTLLATMTIGAATMASADQNGAFKGNGGMNRGACSIESYMNDEGMTFDEAKAAALEDQYARIDTAVEDGKMTSDEADALKAKMAEKSESLTELGQGNPRMMKGRNKGDNPMKGQSLKSYMDEGMTFDEAKAAVLEDQYARLDTAVEDGKMTSDEADTIKAEMAERSENLTEPGENVQNKENGRGPHKGFGLNRTNKDA